MAERAAALTAGLVVTILVCCAPADDGQQRQPVHRGVAVQVMPSAPAAPDALPPEPAPDRAPAGPRLITATVEPPGARPVLGAPPAGYFATEAPGEPGPDDGLAALSRQIEEVMEELDRLVAESLGLQEALLRLRIRSGREGVGDGGLGNNEQSPDAP